MGGRGLGVGGLVGSKKPFVVFKFPFVLLNFKNVVNFGFAFFRIFGNCKICTIVQLS